MDLKLVKRGKGEFIKTYRPRRFCEMADTFRKDAFIKLISSEDRPHSYLFKGIRGTGKTTLGYIFAKWLNCDNKKDGEPCLECDHCLSIESGCPDVIDINVADKRTIENARELIEGISYNPAYLNNKVIILDEVQQMTGNAQESLLKAIDGAGGNVYFVLCTMEPRKVEKALRERCTGEFDFKGLSFNEKVDFMVAVLDGENIKYDYSDLEKIADEIPSSPRSVLKAIQMFSCGGLDAVIDKEETEALNLFAQKLIKGDDSFLTDIKKSKMFSGNSEIETTRIKLAGYFRSCVINARTVQERKKFTVALGALTEPYYGGDALNRLTYNLIKAFVMMRS